MYYQNPYLYPQQQYYSPQPVAMQPQFPTIIGKIAENVDMVRTFEIPVGGFGVYPLSDMSKVIVKSYDKDGNLQYLTYELSKPVKSEKSETFDAKLNEIYDFLAKMDKKIDVFGKNSTPSVAMKRRKVGEEDE